MTVEITLQAFNEHPLITGYPPVRHFSCGAIPRSHSSCPSIIRWERYEAQRFRCYKVGTELFISRCARTDARFIFSQMFNPTIMLLIGGFTIAAVLSKTRLDVMTATRILNAAGSKPSVVLLVLMCVATFASMWISNVAAPTLCYALVKVGSL
jgi:hypothetical protein